MRLSTHYKSMKIIPVILFFLLVSGFTLTAQTAPTATTDAATLVTETTATVNATINANGNSTTVTFWYYYGGNDPVSMAATPGTVTGSSDTPVLAALTGLLPDTEYTFFVEATNAGGTTYGSELTFTTDPLVGVPQVITQDASSVTTTTVTLNGLVDDAGSDTTVTFEYGTGAGYGSTVAATPGTVTSGSGYTAVTADLTGLTPDTEYHFRVVGTNAVGTTYGGDMSFITTVGAPTATTEDVTYSTTANSITLNGVVNANNQSTTVTFEYGTASGVYGAPVGASPGTVTGSADTAVILFINGSLTPDTMYYYRVTATNADGTVNGDEMTFFNTTLPYAETTAATGIGSTTATINGMVSPKTVENSSGNTPVTFEYGLTPSYGSTITANESPVNGVVPTPVGADLTGLAPNTEYHYRVTLTNGYGTSNGADMTFTTSSIPTVETLGATPVNAGGATVRGMVNANGDSTTVTFEYGTDTSYGQTRTATQSPVTGTADTAVSRALTGLSTNTVYHYRVTATNSGGTAYGEDMTFITGVSPPTATTDAATAVAVDSATLNGTVNANGNSTTVTFEYGTTTAYDRTGPAVQSPVTGSSDTAVSLSATGLDPDTLYHYRVKAESVGGTIYGADMTFTTTQAPTVTTNGATATSATGATLNGTVNANSQSTTVTFEYGLTTSYGTTVTADQSPVTGSTDTAVSRAITGLAGGSTYHYRVVGTNSSGTSYGADMTFSAVAAAAPTATTDPATLVVADGATLHGTVNANNAATTVTFQYSTDLSYGNSVAAVPGTVNGATDTAVSATLTGLAATTLYNYRVVATNASGTTNGANQTFTTGNVPGVTVLPATAVGDTIATLNGTVNNSFDGASTTVTFEYSIDLSYSNSVNANPNVVTGTTDTAVTADITGLTINTTYNYRVRAQNFFGTTLSGNMTFTTFANVPAVTNAATGVGSTTATANGTVNANDLSTTVTFEYGLDTNYGQFTGGTPSPVTGSTNTAVSGSLTGLTPSTTYHFRVAATNSSGTFYGADMTFTTTGAAPSAATNGATGVGNTTATLNGTVNANNADATVTFQWGTTIAYGSTATAAESPVTGAANTAVSAPLTGLTPGVTYHYRVAATNASGTTYGADMTFLAGTLPPTAVTNAASPVGGNSATLHGIVNANNADTTVTFEFGLDTGYGATYTASQSPVTGNTDTAVSSAVTGLAGDTTYHYRVAATNASGTTYGADQMFTTTVAGAPTVTTRYVAFIAATSARCGGDVTDEGGAPVTERGVVWSYHSDPTIADNVIPDGSGPGLYLCYFTGLSETTVHYTRAYATNAYGTAYGQLRRFVTKNGLIDVTITEPSEGETVSGTITIAATASVTEISNAASITMVEFYIDGTKIATDTTAPYETSWDSSTVADGERTIVAMATDSNAQTSQDQVTVIVDNTGGGGTPEIDVSPASLNFASVGTDVTHPQTLLINNSGGGTLNWAVSNGETWLTCTPGYGAGAGIVTVSVDPTGLAAGTYTDTISVTDAAASNSPETVEVNLTVYDSGTTAPPFGAFETPVDGSTVMSSIPVTGWVLDDIGVANVQILRAPVDGEGGGMVYIGDAVLVDGARPDVEAMYPDYPANYQAGWGYMMLTNFLPNGGNGTFTLYAEATDMEGNTITLGSKTITVDNASAVKPFGAIDTPEQGGTASGSGFVNFGWALTPLPNTIPTDGSTIDVYVDGVNLGNPVYNQYRKDIADLFPGYNNSGGAVGYFYLDTTMYVNGVHTIAWSVEDDAGNMDGIGSRYFSIANTGGRYAQAAGIPNLKDAVGGLPLQAAVPGTDNGRIVIREMEHFSLQLGQEVKAAQGYLEVNGELRRLPVGSTLANTGAFSWQPGPGFLGDYSMVFVLEDGVKNRVKLRLTVTIIPKH